MPACFPVRGRQIHRARSYKMLAHFNVRPGGHAGLFPCPRPSPPPCSQLQNAGAFQCSPWRTCRPPGFVPGLARIAGADGVFPGVRSRKVTFSGTRGGISEVCSEFSGISGTRGGLFEVCSEFGGISGTRGGLSEVCSEFSGISGTKCSRSVNFCRTGNTPPVSSVGEIGLLVQNLEAGFHQLVQVTPDCIPMEEALKAEVAERNLREAVRTVLASLFG